MQRSEVLSILRLKAYRRRWQFLSPAGEQLGKAA